MRCAPLSVAMRPRTTHQGMRIVREKADFEDMLAACKRESLASFSDDRVLVEK